MPITEKLMGSGSFQIKLRADTPRYFVDTYTGERLLNNQEQDIDSLVTSYPTFWLNSLNFFNHIIITPARLSLHRLDMASLIAESRYTGRLEVVSQNGQSLEGTGLAVWFGDDEGKGDILETVHALEDATFSEWMDLLIPTGLHLKKGTIGSVPGVFSWGSIYESRRDAIQRVCDYFGAEWRVRPDGYIDLGLPTELFQDNPDIIVTREAGSVEPDIRGLNTQDLQYAIDLRQWASRVIGIGQGFNYDVAIAEADLVDPYFSDLFGQPAHTTKTIDISDITSDDHMENLCYQELTRSDVKERISLSTSTYAIPKHVLPGDWIYVFDPSKVGLFVVGGRDADDINTIMYRGIPCRPKKMRVYGYTWPLEEGMGVYRLHWPQGSNPVIHDLTPYVEWEDGTTQFDPEAPQRIDPEELKIPPVELLPFNGESGIMP